MRIGSGLIFAVSQWKILHSRVHYSNWFLIVDKESCVLVVLLLTDGLYKSKFVKMWDRETLQLTDSIYSILRTLYRWATKPGK